jgi:hypothetical protein
MAAPRRSDDEHLRLFMRVTEGMFAEPAAAGQFGLKVNFDRSTTSVDESLPRQQDLKSLLMEVRKLDQPREDVYLPDIIDLVLARATDPEWIAGLRKARQHYDAFQQNGPFQLVDTIGPITPRGAFDLWVYGDKLHNDYDKEQRLAAMGPVLAGMVTQVGAMYMDDLMRVAAYARAVILDDPALASVRS